MLLLKEHWVGGNLTFFGPPRLSTKKVRLLRKLREFFCVCFILFRPQETKLYEKSPPGVFFGVFRHSKYENTNKHVLVWARNIHE